MFRMWVFRDYKVDSFYGMNPLMTYILVGTFVGLESIVAINLLIAMLNDAFSGSAGDLTETLYMQRAIVLLQLKKLPFFAGKAETLQSIHQMPGPFVEPFNTDTGILEQQDDIKNAIFEIKTTLEEFLQKIQNDEHSIFLQKVEVQFGEEEVIGKRSTAMSMEMMASIRKDVGNLQKVVTMLHRQQNHSYNHLKNTIKMLNTLLEKELHSDSKKDYTISDETTETVNFNSRVFSFLDSVTSRLSQRRHGKESEESVTPSKV
ncbi:uncharacterized protein LOC103185107 [Callorhinchus milii]|uniref:uncharacterized protein LOC103185107 n=1 Tax=Callorhinchus milii TaxID=7868 RepID=UPI001C3FA8D5|nr:uncharacterized protein LOC103185107 [Callorhinchus milii]